MIAPEYGVVPSRKSGTSAPPEVSDVTVLVADSELTLTWPPAPSSSTRKMFPDGLENFKPVVPSALEICAMTEAMP